MELDYIIGQDFGLPVGMQRHSSEEFKKRVIAAVGSYQLRLKSIDYTLRHYTERAFKDQIDVHLGDSVSDYLRDSSRFLLRGLKELHKQSEMNFGVFGAEITMFRIPDALDTARMLANRGLLLESLPLLRLCLEMLSWAYVAYGLQDENQVIELQAQACITKLKTLYKTAGQFYGYLSSFSHWRHVVHGRFLNFDVAHVVVVKASAQYRAMALALCLVVLDVFVEVIRRLYPDKCQPIQIQVQGMEFQDPGRRRTSQYLDEIAELCSLEEIDEILAFIDRAT